MQLEFAKYEGAGNDFILIDMRNAPFIPESKTVANLCDRHFGIGADGLMTLGSGSDDCDCSMRYYNADGSAGEMCGNGGRCFTLFAHHLGIGGSTLRFDALDGRHDARLLSTDSFSGIIELGMIDVHRIEQGDGWWFLNTGVPHYVEFTDDLAAVEVIGHGRAIRRDTSRFPQGTNVNFVQILGEGRIGIRTYERGVETETLACGTGATAAALVSSFAYQPTVRHFSVSVAGGELKIAFEHTGNTYHNIKLSGPARQVFRGMIHTENF